MASQEPDPTTLAGAPADTPDKAELIAELADARAGLAEGGAELAQHLDARERLVQAGRERPLLCAGAAAAAGFALAMFLRGGRGGSTPRSGGPSPGLTGTLAASVVSAVQPALAKYAQNALTKVVGEALHESPESDDPPSH